MRKNWIFRRQSLGLERRKPSENRGFTRFYFMKKNFYTAVFLTVFPYDIRRRGTFSMKRWRQAPIYNMLL